VNDSRPWWLWPNLLALDAPAVAVTWQLFFASVAGIAVPLAATVVLGLVVWGVYLADRGLDARGGTTSSDRHRAAAHNFVAWMTTAAAALTSAGILALAALPLSYLRAGLAVAAVSVGYFVAVHVARAERLLGRGLKEASVGLVFALGAAIPLIAAVEADTSWATGVVAFAGLCWLNCLLISVWEEAPDRRPSVPVVIGAGAVAVGAAVGAAVPVAVAVVVSTAALAGLHVLRSRISVRAARVWADGVLLSPLLVVVCS
jgi:hypothetical protein